MVFWAAFFAAFEIICHCPPGKHGKEVSAEIKEKNPRNDSVMNQKHPVFTQVRRSLETLQPASDLHEVRSCDHHSAAGEWVCDRGSGGK